MSASLDDMPAYEHFQDELDFELKRYAHKNTRKNTHAENEFIQYVCFELFLSKPEQVTTEIINHYFEATPLSKTAVYPFLEFMNTDSESYLKNTFTY
jgi:hypothetical protein